MRRGASSCRSVPDAIAVLRELKTAFQPKRYFGPSLYDVCIEGEYVAAVRYIVSLNNKTVTTTLVADMALESAMNVAVPGAMKSPLRDARSNLDRHALLVTLVTLAAIQIGPALASDLIGTARVVDGDTIGINGQRVRLFGIDAPEGGQTCSRQGTAYDCGQEATQALADLLNGKTFTAFIVTLTDIDASSRLVISAAGVDMT